MFTFATPRNPGSMGWAPMGRAPIGWDPRGRAPIGQNPLGPQGTRNFPVRVLASSALTTVS